MADERTLLLALSQFARSLAAGFEMDEVLQDLAQQVTKVLGLAGAGVSLADGSMIRFATALDEVTTAVARLQEDLQEGPCADAYRSGEPVLVADLRDDPDHWPGFARRAIALGVVAVAAIPMRLDDTRLGALNLYATSRRNWSDEDVTAAQVLADVATGYLAHASELDRSRRVAEQLQEALSSRVVIEQAKGMLAAERHISVDEAFEVIRSQARSRGASLRAVATAIVNLGLRPLPGFTAGLRSVLPGRRSAGQFVLPRGGGQRPLALIPGPGLRLKITVPVPDGCTLPWTSGKAPKALGAGGIWGEAWSSMGVSGTLRRTGRSDGAGGPGIDLIAPKLHPPMIRPGTVPRPTLIERLARDGSRPIVSVVAPAGYGKTTLLTQWAEGNGRALAWVSVEESDNDPKVLLTYVATALDAVEPVDERVFDALASPGCSVPGSVVPRLGSALSSMTSPVALVLDDVHVLHDQECRAALSVLSDHMPGGSRLVMAGRAEPPLRMARLRAEDKVTEIGAGDLALTRDDAATLLRAVGVVLSDDEVAALHRRAEGWPAGLYMAALYLREGGPLADALSFGGADRLVSEYVEAEFLERISPQQRVFLTRTAVLTRMCGPLCEGVLDQPGAAATLADIARSNLLLVRLDRHGEWYRYHQLFRDMLLAELHRREPGLIPVLQRRAAEWHERAGTPVAALEYWMEAGDADAAARLAGALAFAAYQQAKITTVERWFAWLEAHQAMENHPGLAVLAALLSSLTGKPADAERWARLAEQRADLVARLPDGSSSIEPWLALLRALLCRNGVAQMRADAELAVTTMAAGSFLQVASAMFLAIAHLMAGDPGRADAIFEDAAATGKARGITVGVCVALAERSLLAANAGAWQQARLHLSEAQVLAREANLEDYPPVTILYTVAARLALQEDDRSRARAALTRAQRLRPALTHALPHLAVQARIELARCHLALSDYAAARVLLREVDEILRLRPDLGVFNAQAEDLHAELARARSFSAPQASALSAAELRVLPMLSTHLSFPEIGAQMFLSRYTVKAQATSVYRKLGVSSRSQAVARARELGLLDE